MTKFSVYAAVPTHLPRTKPAYDRHGQSSESYVYPKSVAKGEKIGEFKSVAEIYSHLRQSLSVGGARCVAALWGDKGYMSVSLYDGGDFAQNAKGARIPKFCQ